MVKYTVAAGIVSYMIRERKCSALARSARAPSSRVFGGLRIEDQRALQFVGNVSPRIPPQLVIEAVLGRVLHDQDGPRPRQLRNRDEGGSESEQPFLRLKDRRIPWWPGARNRAPRAAASKSPFAG